MNQTSASGERNSINESTTSGDGAQVDHGSSRQSEVDHDRLLAVEGHAHSRAHDPARYRVRGLFRSYAAAWRQLGSEGAAANARTALQQHVDALARADAVLAGLAPPHPETAEPAVAS